MCVHVSKDEPQEIGNWIRRGSRARAAAGLPSAASRATSEWMGEAGRPRVIRERG